MKDNSIRFSFLFATVLGVVSYIALWEGCFGACSFITDSVYYMQFAERIIGNGVPDGWFATWPIGYPVVLAAVKGVTGLDVFVASKVLGVVMCGVLLLLFKKYSPRAFPLLALGLLNLAFLKIYRSTLSEQCFIPVLVMLGFWAFESSCRRGSTRIAMLCMAFCGVFLFRYVGVFAPIWILGGCLLEPLVKRLIAHKPFSAECRKRLVDVSIAGVAAWGLEGGYLVINKIMTGCATGMARVETDREILPLLKGIVGACFREIQVFGVLFFLVALLLLLANGIVFRGDSRHVTRMRLFSAFSGRPLFFISVGLFYHMTMVALKCVGNFNDLGFRLLYPGTIMMVIGVSLAISEIVDFEMLIRKMSLKRYCLYLMLVVLAGSQMLSMELAVRKSLGISVYGIGAPYLKVKNTLLEKYKEVPRGGRVLLRQGLGSPDFFIGCLRPDLIIEFPEGAKKY